MLRRPSPNPHPDQDVEHVEGEADADQQRAEQRELPCDAAQFRTDELWKQH